MYKNIILSSLLFLFFACETSMDAKMHNIQDARWHAVMANHDVVMPMMGTTNKVRKQLKKVKTENPVLPNEQVEKINQLIGDLDKADEGMMDWMNGFQPLKKLQATKEHQEILKYLEEQDIEIKRVGIEMTNSIKAGTDFLENLAQ